MNEKELGRALLTLDLTANAPPNPAQLTQNILKRDARRVRLLASLTACLWLLATGGVVWMVCFYFLYLDPRLRAYGAGRAHLENDVYAWVIVLEWAAWSVLAWIVTLLLAALATVALILFSRRVTLRQINANLVQISEQLKRLQPATTA